MSWGVGRVHLGGGGEGGWDELGSSPGGSARSRGCKMIGALVRWSLKRNRTYGLGF